MFWDITYVSLLNTKLNQVDCYLKVKKKKKKTLHNMSPDTWGWRGKLATLAENPSSTQGSSNSIPGGPDAFFWSPRALAHILPKSPSPN